MLATVEAVDNVFASTDEFDLGFNFVACLVVTEADAAWSCGRKKEKKHWKGSLELV